MNHPVLFRTIPQVAIGAAFISLATTAEAVSYFKANNTTNLNNSGSWTDSVGAAVTTAPANTSGSDSDIWNWNSQVLAANSVSMGGDVRLKTITIVDPAGPVTIDGVTRTMSISNGGGVDMSAATQDLTINNLTTSSNSGMRVLGSNYAIGINVAANRTFTLNSKLAVNGGSGGVTVTFNGAGTSVFNDQVQPSNLIINAGEVRLNSATGSTRNGTNTTTVNGGRLVINNTSGSATGSGAVNVNNTATLTGQGSIAGVVTVASGATLIPNTGGVGSLTTGGLSLAAGSTIKWEAVDATQADLITVNNADGLVVNGGTVELYNAGTNTPFSGTGTFNLFAFNGAIGGAGISSLAVAESSKIAGQTYTFNVSGNFVTLTIEVGSRPQSFWNVNNDGTWGTAANWTSNGVPNDVSAIANLGGAEGTPITQARTVTLAAATKVGVLKFDSAQSFTVAGASALSFDDGAVGAKVQVINGSHTISTPLALTDNGLLASVENAASTLTLGGQIDGNGGLSKSGPGTLVVTGDTYYLGSTSVGAGTLQVGNGSTTGSINGPISNSGTVRYNRSDDVTLNYGISGTGGVAFAGTGKTILNVTNTFSGPTTITAGTVELSEGAALQNSTLTYSAGGGSLTLPDFLTSVTLGGLAGDRAIPLVNAIGDPVSLTVGQNNASTSYTASTTDTGAAFTKLGSGTLALTGSHTFNGAATISAGVVSLDGGSSFSAGSVSTVATGAKLVLNGGTLHITGGTSFENASAGFELKSGTATIDGTISHPANISSGNLFINVSGGTLNAEGVTLSKGALNLGTTEPASGSTSAGLYIHDSGIVNITGNMLLGNNANSSVNCRIDGGSLTVNGTTTVGIDSPDRWSMIDVSGGTFTSTHVAGGVFLGLPTAATNSRGQAIMHVRGTGVAKAERFQFGQAALGGNSVLRLSGGELYVGAGGMTIGSTNPAFVGLVRLEGGILGALGTSTSNVPVNLNGAAVVTGSGPANEPQVMTLTGTTTGTGSLTKNGAGTVIFSSAANNLSATTTVNAGTLGLAGQTSGLVTVNAGSTLAPQGALSANGGAVINGTLNLAYDNLATPQVSRITSSAGAITLGAGSALVFSGTGTVDGASHVILKASGGVTGTFGTVTGLPTGFTLNYAYDDDANAATPPVVAIVNSSVVTPFNSWIQAYVTGGSVPAGKAGPTDDPDSDGVDNITEFAFDGDPGHGSNIGKIFGLAADGGDVDTQKQLLLTVAVRTGTSFTAGTPATGSSADGVNYSIEGSTGLASFATGVSVEATAVTPPNAPALNTGWEWQTFSLDGSNGLTGKGFLRAKATAAP